MLEPKTLLVLEDAINSRIARLGLNRPKRLDAIDAAPAGD